MAQAAADDFEDVDPADFEDVAPGAPADQGPPLDWEGAKRALDEIAAGVKPRYLGPGAQQALMQVLNAKRGPQKLSALEAANATGANMALMGLPQEMSPQIKERVQLAKSQHPGVSLASEMAGGAGAGMMAPAGALSNAVQGGLTGWNMSEAQDPIQRAKEAAMGAFAGVAIPATLEGIGDIGRRAVSSAGRASGGAMKKLAELLGHKPAANAPMDERAAQFASVADDVAAANAAPQQAAPNIGTKLDPIAEGESLDTFAGRVQQGVNELGPTKPGAPQAREPNAVDMEALKRLQDSNRFGHWTPPDVDVRDTVISGPPDMGKMRSTVDPVPPEVAEKATGNVRLGQGAQEALQNMQSDTSPMSMYDATHLWDLSQGPLSEGPLVRNPARKSGNAIDALSEFARMQEQAPKASPAPVAPLDPVAAKKQAIIDAQKANPEALAAFGVDPKNGERGFLDLGSAYAAYKGMEKGYQAMKSSAPSIYQAGERLQQASANMAKKASSDPGVLMQLLREGGALSGAARAILQAAQSGDAKTVKAQSMLLEMSPEFRERFAQGTGEQGLSAQAATAR